MLLDAELCYRAVGGRDRRFDGQFIVAVRTTGIYCRPSCPAMTPKQRNVEFYPTAAAAQLRGYRACRRCLPDAVPGSPDWDTSADLAARAMRLISDGVVERDGVGGLAARLGYSERQLGRVLTAELGAGPLALARSHRAHAARLLIETTALGFADVAFSAGFSSVRQFNDTIRSVYGVTPTTLRAEAARRKGRTPPTPGSLTLRLPVRLPLDADGLFAFLAARAVAGVELAGPTSYARTLALGGGPATVRVEVEPGAEHVRATLALGDLRDLTSAVSRVRRLLDLDADPQAVDAVLSADPALAGALAGTPGIRVPGSVDGTETLMRAMLGQQVTVAAARTAAARLTAALGERVQPTDTTQPGLPDRLFPTAAAIAEHGREVLTGPAQRVASIVGVAAAVADGSLRLDVGRHPEELRRELEAMPGLGPWTAGYVVMRVLGSPDELLVTDVALRRGAALLNLPSDVDSLRRYGRRWRPWRSYAGMHLWRAAAITKPRRKSA